MTKKTSVLAIKDPFSEWFERVYEENFERLYRYAFSIVKEKHFAEDIVSEVFFNLWNNKTAEQEIDNVGVYLFVAVKNQAVRLASHPKKLNRFDHSETHEIKETVNPESLLMGKELGEIILEVIDTSSPHLQLVYNLSRNKGLSNQEIADELGISKRTVEHQLYQIIKKMKDKLSSCYPHSDLTYQLFKVGVSIFCLSGILRLL